MIGHGTEQTPIPPGQPAVPSVEFTPEDLCILEKFNKEFIEAQKPLESEDMQLLEENIWDLI